jgi:hypothetical protein
MLSVKLASKLEFIKNTIQKEKTYKLDDAISHDENLQWDESCPSHTKLF